MIWQMAVSNVGKKNTLMEAWNLSSMMSHSRRMKAMTNRGDLGHRFRSTQFSGRLAPAFGDPGQHLPLQPKLDRKRPSPAPIVVDTETGQQVSFQECTSPMRLAPARDPIIHAAWLTGKPDRIMTFVSKRPCEPIAWLADVRDGSLLSIAIPNVQHLGTSSLFAVCSKEGMTADILCCVARLQDQIGVFNASSGQHLHQLSCPQELHQQFLQAQHDTLSPDQTAWSSRDIPEDAAIIARRLLLAPNKDLLAVLWQYCILPHPTFARWRITSAGVSIQSAIN